MVLYEAVRMTAGIQSIQLSAPKSPFLKLGNNTLQKQVDKNASRSKMRGLETQGPPNCKMLTVFFFFRCLFVDKTKDVTDR